MKRLLIVFLCLLSFCQSQSYIDFREINQNKIHIVIVTEQQERKEMMVKVNSTIKDIAKMIPIDFQKRRYNPNQVLHDGDVLFLNSKVPSKISLNEADLKELMKLKGVGKKMAQRILEYRKEKGLFQKIEDLQKVKGIGDKKYEELKDQITL